MIEKSGTWLSYGKTRLGQGREKARDFLKENPELISGLERDIRKALGVEIGDAPVTHLGAGAPRPVAAVSAARPAEAVKESVEAEAGRAKGK